MKTTLGGSLSREFKAALVAEKCCAGGKTYTIYRAARAAQQAGYVTTAHGSASGLSIGKGEYLLVLGGNECCFAERHIGTRPEITKAVQIDAAGRRIYPDLRTTHIKTPLPPVRFE